jgi:hypothetical protein
MTAPALAVACSGLVLPGQLAAALLPRGGGRG